MTKDLIVESPFSSYSVVGAAEWQQKEDRMGIALLPNEMTELVAHFVDSFEITAEQAQRCREVVENGANSEKRKTNDPLVLMAFACMNYGCMRYPDALRDVRKAKSLFQRKDNPMHYDALCVLEASILSALSRSEQALACIHRHIAQSEGECQRQLRLMSIELYRMHGQYENAILLIDSLKAKARDEYQQHLLTLSGQLCDRDQNGNHQAFCAQASASYWNLCDIAGSDRVARHLIAAYGSELAYSYAWQGRMDVAQSVLSQMGSVEPNGSTVSYLAARALALSADQHYDEALDLISDEHLHLPGVSLDHAFIAQVVRLIILHFAGHKREAAALAVRLSEYGRMNPGLNLSSTAQLLMVSVLLWFFDYAQAQSLMAACFTNSHWVLQRSAEQATQACLEALIAHRMRGSDDAIAALKKARNSLCDPNASLIVACLCAAHPALLGLIGRALEVESIPCNVTELLDHARYHEAITVSSDLLSVEQGALFQKRFTRVDTGLKIIYDEERVKPISIQLFGGLTLKIQGKPIDMSSWSRSKSHQLFLRTALEKGADLPREATFSLLWPDRDRTIASNNYYVTLSKMYSDIKQKCEISDPSEIISRSSSGKIRLNRSMCECDIAQFDHAALEARKRVIEHDGSRALQHFYRMVELYRGDLLVGDFDYPWLEQYRVRYRKQFVDSMIAACLLCLDLGQPNETHFFIDAAFKHNANREAFYELSMRAYKAMGRREDALNAYYECVEYLHETLGLDPSPGFQALFNDLLKS